MRIVMNEQGDFVGKFDERKAKVIGINAKSNGHEKILQTAKGNFVIEYGGMRQGECELIFKNEAFFSVGVVGIY